MHRRNLIVLVVSVVALSLGCVAASTHVTTKASACPDSGIVYRLPKRLFVLSVTLDKKNVITKIEAKATEPIPDVDHNQPQLCGVFEANILAENTVDFGVSESGLLTTANAKSVSKVAESLKEIAETAGYGTIFGFDGIDQPRPALVRKCAPGLTHSIVIDPSDTAKNHSLCDIKFEIKGPEGPKNPGGSDDPVKGLSAPMEENTSYGGVFYRQDEPYVVTAKGQNGENYSTVLFAPNRSPVQFLPLPRSFFADSDATLKFSGGMPTQYKRQAGSEFLGLVSIPADIIGAYLDAVGTVFSKIGTANSAEAKADALIHQQATALADQERKRIAAEEKLRRCQDAISSDDDAKIASACQ